MKVMIFGSNGQDGHYLSKLLRAKQIETIRVSRRGEDGVMGDVADFGTVKALITTHRPDMVFHFAANSTTRHEALFENHEAIATGTLNILESVRTSPLPAKVFVSGSGLQFKNTGAPISENDQFQARDAYSVARIQSVYAARYFRGLGLPVYVGYFFNHDSPLRSERHLTQTIAQTVKAIAAGKDRQLEIGNLQTKKEWGYAGDIVEAVWTLVNQDQVFEATLGTGEAYSVQHFAEICFNKIGKDWTKYVVSKPGFETAYDTLVSDTSTIFSLGWRPATGIEQLADIMLTG